MEKSLRLENGKSLGILAEQSPISNFEFKQAHILRWGSKSLLKYGPFAEASIRVWGKFEGKRPRMSGIFAGKRV